MSVTKVYVDSTSNSRNRRRVEADEKELEELLNKTKETPEEDKKEEEEVKVVTQEPELETSDPEEKSFKKRYGDLRRHFAEK